LLKQQLKALLCVAARLLSVLALRDVREARDTPQYAAKPVAQRADMQLIAVCLLRRPQLQGSCMAMQRGEEQRVVGLPALAVKHLVGTPPFDLAGRQAVALESPTGHQQ
jgi:hypothetical protein